MATEDDFLDAIRRPDGSLPPFPSRRRKCRICGKPNDHFHQKWDALRSVWYIVREPED